MSEPFLGQLMIVGFNFPPRGWAMCDGQILPISQNQALYSLLGTMYGGDGRTSFALPDLRGRTPLHFGNGSTQGSSFGEENHLLTLAELPAHSHNVQAQSGAATEVGPAGNFWAGSGQQDLYAASADTAMQAGALSNAGGNQGHNNMAPFLVLNVVIALQGIFPPRN